MATLLTKDINRQTIAVTTRRGEPVIVTLKAGDLLEFRVKGKRTRSNVSLAHCFRLAEILSIEEVYSKRMAEYNHKTKVLKVKGLRRPKRQSIPASQFYFQATKL